MPLISTHVFGAMVVLPPSAFATSVITGEGCAHATGQITKKLGGITSRILRRSFILKIDLPQPLMYPFLLTDGNHNGRIRGLIMLKSFCPGRLVSSGAQTDLRHVLRTFHSGVGGSGSPILKGIQANDTAARFAGWPGCILIGDRGQKGKVPVEPAWKDMNSSDGL